jgi:uncharacterized protein YxeA
MKTNKKLLIILVMIIVLLIVGVGGHYFIKNNIEQSKLLESNTDIADNSENISNENEPETEYSKQQISNNEESLDETLKNLFQEEHNDVGSGELTFLDSGKDSFWQPIRAYFAKDNLYVYYILGGKLDEVRVLEGADPETFEIISKTYSKDKKRVYSYYRSEFQEEGEKHLANDILALAGVDTETFGLVIYSNGQDANWLSYDKNYVYSFQKKIDYADPITFKHYDRNYFIDNDSVFYISPESIYLSLVKNNVDTSDFGVYMAKPLIYSDSENFYTLDEANLVIEDLVDLDSYLENTGVQTGSN